MVMKAAQREAGVCDCHSSVFHGVWYSRAREVRLPERRLSKLREVIPQVLSGGSFQQVSPEEPAALW